MRCSMTVLHSIGRSAAPGIWVLMVSLLTGCVNPAPKYQQPASPVGASYNAAWPNSTAPPSDGENRNSDTTPDAPVASGADGGPAISNQYRQPLRHMFLDQRLQGLLARALNNNRDLRLANATIAQARAQYGIQKAASFPNLTASASGNNARQPTSILPPGQPAVNHQYSVALGVTAYELDFFGRVRSLKAGAKERFLATEQARRITRISLVTEVVNSWLNWSADYDRLALAKNIQHSQEKTLGLLQKRFDLGNISAIELHQQQVALAGARSQVAILTGQNAKNRNALELLLGGPVPDKFAPTGFGEQLHQGERRILAAVPAGIPSDLMLRRPDLLQSEHSLKAANADIGLARAAFYPSISLTASAGSASAELDNLFRQGSRAWSFAPQLNLPIFAGGANRANLKKAKAQRDMALARYEKAIQTAFREVSDTLVDRVSISAQLSAQRALVDASGEAYSLTQARYKRGLDSWLDVLNAERTHSNARTGLITIYANKLTNSVNLYKALGGDWLDHTAEASG